MEPFCLLAYLSVCLLGFLIWILELLLPTRMTISLFEKCSTCAVFGPTGYHPLIPRRKKVQTIEKGSSVGADGRESIACGIHLPSLKARLISTGIFLCSVSFFSLLSISLVTALAFHRVTNIVISQETRLCWQLKEK